MNTKPETITDTENEAKPTKVESKTELTRKRRERVWTMLQRRATYRFIAYQLKTNLSMIQRDVAYIFEHPEEFGTPKKENLKTINQALLDSCIRSLSANAANGDVPSIKAIREIVQEENKMFGLYEADKIDANISGNVTSNLDLSKLTVDELELLKELRSKMDA